MKTRKLQKVGGGTYTVSVPKGWADKQHLEAGSTVHLYTHIDGSLVVRTARKDGGHLDTTRVDIDSRSSEIVKHTLRAAYTIGFDTVTLAAAGSFTDDQRRVANVTVRDLIGMEIVGEGNGEITVQNLLDASDVSIRQSVIQLQFIVRSMYRRATGTLADGESDAAEELHERAGEADRLFEMISRHFNRSLSSLEEVDRLGLTRPELFDYYVVARRLGRVADHATEIARVGGGLSDAPGEVVDDTRAAADAAGRIVDDATTAVLGGDGERGAHGVLDRSDETVADIRAVDRALFDCSIEGAYAVARVLDRLARTVECGQRIAETAIRGKRRSG